MRAALVRVGVVAWCGLALLACSACGAARPPEPARLAPIPVPAPEPQCAQDRARALELTNDGDRAVKVNVEGAIASYVRAAELFPSEPRILWKLALAYEKTEDWAHMEATLARATELAPNVAHYAFKQGYAWMMQGPSDRAAFERAKGPLQRCVALDPNLAACHFLLAAAYLWSDQNELALREYSLAIEHDPERGSLYPPLVELYHDFGLHEQAEQVAKEGTRVVARSAKTSAALFALEMYLANAARTKGDAAGQRAGLTRALEDLSDEHPELAFELGAAYAALEPPDKARASQLLIQFSKSVCRSHAAAKFKEQCEQAQATLQRLGL